MHRTIAYDVYRYYTRDYANNSAHCRKMMCKHGDAKWHAAVVIGHGVIREHGETRCMAFCVDEIARAMEATYPTDGNAVG